MILPIKISVQCRLRNPFILEAHPQMNIVELTQFLLCSQILHSSSQEQQKPRPIGFVSKNNYLLIDSMLSLLAISDRTVKELFTVYRYAMARERLSVPYLRHEDYQKLKIHDNDQVLAIKVVYDEEDMSKRGEITCYVQEKEIGAIEEKPTSLIEYPTREKYLKFNQILEKNEGDGSITLKKYINKADLESFDRVQQVILLKKKLIQHRQNRLTIFGELKEISQEQQNIVFSFAFVPAISLSDIMCLQYTYLTVESLINKIWAFLIYLKNNNYESYICRLYRKRNLKVILDTFQLCLSNRFIVTDLNMLLEEGGSERFQQNEEQGLLQDVRVYVKLHKSHLNKYDDYVQIEQEKSMNIISSLTFSKLYLAKNYRSFNRSREHYSPKTDQFTWSVEQLNPQTQKEKNVNEATTAKKPRSNAHIFVEKKGRKRGEQSSDYSFVHASVKKTKLKGK